MFGYMEYARIVYLGSELLKFMSENGGTINDWKYLPMYDEFVDLRAQKVRYRAAVEELSAKYGTSKTSVERIIRRFRKILH